MADRQEESYFKVRVKSLKKKNEFSKIQLMSTKLSLGEALHPLLEDVDERIDKVYAPGEDKIIIMHTKWQNFVEITPYFALNLQNYYYF